MSRRVYVPTSLKDLDALRNGDQIQGARIAAYVTDPLRTEVAQQDDVKPGDVEEICEHLVTLVAAHIALEGAGEAQRAGVIVVDAPEDTIAASERDEADGCCVVQRIDRKRIACYFQVSPDDDDAGDVATLWYGPTELDDLITALQPENPTPDNPAAVAS